MKTSALILLLHFISCGANNNYMGDFLEFLLGPRLGNNTHGDQKSDQQTTEQIVTSYGYRLDTHLVTSGTGHILTLHRIPTGRGSRDEVTPRPVAFIHHGLLGCSDMWLLRGPEQDLPYILADSGYDVWLFNVRGNTHSRKHTVLSADEDPLFWNFGIEEIGYYDLPVTIDYILNKTRQKDLFFLGHSIGSSSGFILCSMRPEYRKRIRLFIALGPLTNIKHALMRVHTITFSVGSILLRFAESQNIHEIMPRRPYFTQILQSACEDNSPLQTLCLSMMFSIVGKDLSEFNTKTFPRFVEYYPSGTSLKLLADVLHYYLTGEFARRDFGARLNVERYNSSKPPSYDLSKVTVPVSLHYGSGDLLVSKEDIEDLCHKLPLCVGKFEIPHKHFNHLDFVLAINARSLLYDNLLQLMKKYRNLDFLLTVALITYYK